MTGRDRRSASPTLERLCSERFYQLVGAQLARFLFDTEMHLGTPVRHLARRARQGRPIRNAVLRLIRGMNLRLHPCSVAPADTRRAGHTAPPAEGLSCNNACAGKARSRGTRGRDVIFETLFETLWVSNPIRPRSAASRNRVMRGPGVTQGAKRSQGARRPRN